MESNGLNDVTFLQGQQKSGGYYDTESDAHAAAIHLHNCMTTDGGKVVPGADTKSSDAFQELDMLKGTQGVAIVSLQGLHHCAKTPKVPENGGSTSGQIYWHHCSTHATDWCNIS